MFLKILCNNFICIKNNVVIDPFNFTSLTNRDHFLQLNIYSSIGNALLNFCTNKLRMAEKNYEYFSKEVHRLWAITFKVFLQLKKIYRNRKYGGNIAKLQGSKKILFVTIPI